MRFSTNYNKQTCKMLPSNNHALHLDPGGHVSLLFGFEVNELVKHGILRVGKTWVCEFVGVRSTRGRPLSRLRVSPSLESAVLGFGSSVPWKPDG